jgi:caa(3)-type oxidase subunit IV
MINQPETSLDHHLQPTQRQLWQGPIIVWLVLGVILAASAYSAFIPLGALNPTINLALAAVMLLLLATFLMDLKSASPVVRLVAVAGLFWVIFLFTLTFTDYLSRRPSVPVIPQRGAAAQIQAR